MTQREEYFVQCSERQWLPKLLMLSFIDFLISILYWIPIFCQVELILEMPWLLESEWNIIT